MKIQKRLVIILKDLQESGHKKWLTISIILAKRGLYLKLLLMKKQTKKIRQYVGKIMRWSNENILYMQMELHYSIPNAIKGMHGYTEHMNLDFREDESK